MIRYALICEKGHDFESWFQDSAAYDKQAKRGLVTCPRCGSAKVEKAVMAPRLSATAKKRARRHPSAGANGRDIHNSGGVCTRSDDFTAGAGVSFQA